MIVPVADKPKFHEDHPKVFYVWAGKTREMTCSATGEPEPRVSWKKNGGHLDDTVYSVKTEGRNSSVQVGTAVASNWWLGSLLLVHM